MIRETYKGRKIVVKKGRNWGTLSATVNGEYGSERIGSTEEAVASDVRATIDFIDRDPVPDGSRWGAHWYAPGTYELCAEGIHPQQIGGPCRHPTCGPAAEVAT
jgi:hypothetical protein